MDISTITITMSSFPKLDQTS